MLLAVIFLVVFAFVTVFFGIAAAAAGAVLVAKTVFAVFVLSVGIALLLDLVQSHRQGHRRS